jgi:hypothetical protein
MQYKRVNNDINGNPRFVFHFLAFLGTETGSILDRYQLALKKARKIGGKAYRGKDFGGGIVLQSYNIEDTIQRIQRLTDEG